MTAPRRPRAIGIMTEQTYSERVCVVICSGDVSEDEIRRLLGGGMPLKFIGWSNREYMRAIRNLRPRVIVSAAADGLAEDNAALLGCLLDSANPTIASLVIAHLRLTVRQLGMRTRSHIQSLDDLILE